MTVTDRRSKTQTEKREPSRIEWATGLVSLVLVLALLGWIGREAFMQDKGPPNLSINVTGVSKAQGAYRVEFELINDSASTAAAVKVIGALKSSSGDVETSDVTFDYAPAESRTAGGLLFSSDPQAGTLSIRPAGYSEP